LNEHLTIFSLKIIDKWWVAPCKGFTSIATAHCSNRALWPECSRSMRETAKIRHIQTYKHNRAHTQ
jgi:hypothetical protein